MRRLDGDEQAEEQDEPAEDGLADPQARPVVMTAPPAELRLCRRRVRARPGVTLLDEADVLERGSRPAAWSSFRKAANSSGG